eukprot:Nitzschia sp. Nitz4//scaffold216_size36101//2156//4709//NITZ4_007773-RA/size36101-processed-gene-0.0-mRNA-1//1//CDS//3329542170//592//frame0
MTKPKRKGSTTAVEEDFYAIEKVIGWKGEGRRRLYRVRWVGYSSEEDSWVPPSHLCEDSLREALALVRLDKAQQSHSNDGAGNTKNTKSKKNTTGARSKKNNKNKVHPTPKSIHAKSPRSNSSKRPRLATPTNLSHSFHDTAGPYNNSNTTTYTNMASTGDNYENSIDMHWAESSAPMETQQMQSDLLRAPLFPLRSVQRIHVHSPQAKEQLLHARVNGIPVVLTGHIGWPCFASRWLHPIHTNTANNNQNDINSATEPLDLSQPHRLDLDQLIKDIGKENVPVVQKNYNESNPTENLMQASVFLKKHWPKSSAQPTPPTQGSAKKAKNKVYMQQWQFPNSLTAAQTLNVNQSCHVFPNNILQEDLLPFWLNQGCNPYQYLFMGDTDTCSRLHKDPGGLEIFIAPIVGQKECTMVHREDGGFCFYGLDAPMGDGLVLDLERFPRSAFARVLHLDNVNMKGFLKSMRANDAPELEHSEIIWNASHEIMERVDTFVDAYHASGGNLDANVIEEDALGLRCMRVVCMDIIHMFTEPDPDTHFVPSFTSKDWAYLVQEIEYSLHRFQYRASERPPRFRARSVTVAQQLHSRVFGVDDGKVEYSGKWSLNATYDALLRLLESLPEIHPEERDRVILDSVSLRVGDSVTVRLQHRLADGMIEQVNSPLKAVFVSYEDLPTIFDEYHPENQVKAGAERDPEFSQNQMRPHLLAANEQEQLVRCVPSGGDGEELVAVVIHTMTASFYRVKIELGDRYIHKWVNRQLILRKN